MKKPYLHFMPVALFLLLVGFLWRGLWLEPHHLPSSYIGKPVPSFRLPVLGQPGYYFSSQALVLTTVSTSHRVRSLTRAGEDSRLRRKVAEQPRSGVNFVLLNIFASWCDACKEEQVFLMQLAHQGVVIYGINYKDNPIAAKYWLKNYGNPYQKIGIDEAGQTAIDLGVYGTPETFLVNKQGVIIHRHAGPLNETVWKNEFESLL
jgi:cytochrome c biogenesis protein CcmG/thiol:disulfide interchange protein DsbE